MVIPINLNSLPLGQMHIVEIGRQYKGTIDRVVEKEGIIEVRLFNNCYRESIEMSKWHEDSQLAYLFDLNKYEISESDGKLMITSENPFLQVALTPFVIALRTEYQRPPTISPRA